MATWITVDPAMSEPDALTMLVGRMKVGLLAQHLDISMEDLVAAVLGPTQTTARPSIAFDRRSTPDDAAASEPEDPSQLTFAAFDTGPAPVAEPTPRNSPRADEPTRNELHDAVDRWLIGTALEEENGNITHVADRLLVNRKRIRDRWAKVRHLDPDAMTRCFARMVDSPTPPSPEELHALGSINEIHAAVDRWMVGHLLEREGGNVTYTAQRMGTSRRLVRELRAKLDV